MFEVIVSHTQKELNSQTHTFELSYMSYALEGELNNNNSSVNYV